MPRVCGVILAAGPSSRFGGERPKVLLPFDGEALVRRAARAALDSRLRELFLVVGFRGEEVAVAVAGLAVSVIENPDWRDGQSASVRVAVERLPPTADGALFLPADQPRVTADVIDRLIGAFGKHQAPIVAPSFDGRRGAPVLIGRELFPELALLTGDAGARQLFPRYADRIVDVELDDPAPLEDVDDPEEYARLLTFEPRARPPAGDGED